MKFRYNNTILLFYMFPSVSKTDTLSTSTLMMFKPYFSFSVWYANDWKLSSTEMLFGTDFSYLLTDRPSDRIPPEM